MYGQYSRAVSNQERVIMARVRYSNTFSIICKFNNHTFLFILYQFKVILVKLRSRSIEKVRSCIYVGSFKLKNLPSSQISFHSVVVSTLAFCINDCRFESWSRHSFFNLFFSKMRQKVKKFVSLKARVPGKCQVSFYPLQSISMEM